MKRVLELDAIRGIAALGVVCFHLAPGYAPQGWVAVDCFFVLSGYLITAILLTNREDPHYFFNFYGRRSLRIWPIYYLTLVPVLVAYCSLPTKYPADSALIFQYFSYLQNVEQIWFETAERSIRAYAHTWTLAIEEQFYMLWPLLVPIVTRRGLALSCMAIIAGSVAARQLGMSTNVLPARCDGFALGSLLALIMSGEYAFGDGRGIRHRFMLITVAIAGVTLMLSFWGPHVISHSWGTLRFPRLGAWIIGPVNALFFGVIGIVILNAGRDWLAFLRWRPIVYVGTISYGLYLYHVPVMFAVEAVFRKLGSGHSFDQSRPLFRSLVELMVSITIASLSWRFIEQPILRLKSRLCYVGEADAAIAQDRLGQSVAPSVLSLSPINTSEKPRAGAGQAVCQ